MPPVCQEREREIPCYGKGRNQAPEIDCRHALQTSRFLLRGLWDLETNLARVSRANKLKKEMSECLEIGMTEVRVKANWRWWCDSAHIKLPSVAFVVCYWSFFKTKRYYSRPNIFQLGATKFVDWRFLSQKYSWSAHFNVSMTRNVS